MKESPLSHQLDIYGCWLHVTTNEDEWKRLRKSLPGRLPFVEEFPDSMGQTQFAIHNAKSGVNTAHISIYVDAAAHEGNAARLVDTVAHEATHAASHLFDYLGQSYKGGSVAHAYLIGWVSSRLWQAAW